MSQRAFLRDLASGEAYLAEGAVAVGRDVRHRGRPGRARGPGDRRRTTTGSRSQPGRLRPAARCWSRPPGPSCCPPAWRWSRTPMTSATPACSGARSVPRSSASACRSSRTGSPTRPRAPASRWSARSATPRTSPGGGTCGLDTRPVIGKDGRLLAGPLPWHGQPGRPGGLPGAGRAAGQGGPRSGSPSCCAPAGRAARRARADHARGEVLRERRGAAGDRHHPQWYIRNGGRDPGLREALLARGRELDWHPPHMRARYENWVAGLTGDWLVSRQRYFGVPIPVWYPLDDDGVPQLRRPDRAGRGHAAGRPGGRRAARVRAGPARSARRIHRRPRRDGHLGHVVADPADRAAAGRRRRTCSPGCTRWTCGRRRTRSSGPGCSTRCCARTCSAACCPGGTPRSPAGSWTRTARRCRSPRATCLHPGRPAARVRLGRGQVLGGERAPRRGHGLRPGPAQGRPAARASRSSTRARFVLGIPAPAGPRRPVAAASPSRSTGPCWAGSPTVDARCTARVRGL